MRTLRTKGIILHSLNYRDYDQILTIFTLDEGLVKAVKNGANRPKRRGGVETSPLTEAEFDLVPGRTELMKCREISVLRRHLGCRNTLETLQTSCEILQTLKSSQMPGKPSPPLYSLLLDFLEQIPLSPEPWRLGTEFRIALLRHEGHLPNELCCSACSQSIDALFFSHGEHLCPRHSPPGALKFSKEETDLLLRCSSEAVDSAFSQKVDSLCQWFFA